MAALFGQLAMRALDPTLSLVDRFQVSQLLLALADFGSRRVNGTKKLYGLNGNSFAAAVEFGDRLRARSILVGGQNNNPASAHFTDQVPLFTSHEWKEVAF